MRNRNSTISTGPVVFGILSLLCAPLFAAPNARTVSSAAFGQPIRGIPGRADLRAVVDFGELAQAAKSVLPVEVRDGGVPDFLPIPRKGKVPPEAVGRWQESVVPPPPQAPGGVLSTGTPAPTASFAALGDNNTRIPPDVHGTAGPNHLMTTLNSQVRIQNRSGGTINTVPLYGLTGFWSSLGNLSVFDPKVLFDPYAKRWMFTAVCNARSSTSSVLMGVTQDSNPTGTWNLYRIDADPTDRVWADYPSMGFNKDWIVVNVNLFTVVGDTFIRSDNYAFNKADLYAGGTGLFTLLQDTTLGGAITPALTYDTTVSTMYMLEDWFGNSGGNGFLRLSTITGPVGSEVYTPGVAFPSTPNPWEDIPSVGFVDFAPQLGSTRLIMCNDARMQNTVYRNGFLWCAHTVFLPAGSGTRASVQWWKLTTAGAVSQRGRMDDPAGNLFYAFPSIAVNKNDAVLIGYSRFSAAQFAGGNYAYRLASDPPNTLRNDTVLKAGEAKYDKDFGSGRNRWGDYTNSVVDPVNDVDMWTIQEYAAPRLSGADRWGTWWGKIPEPSDPCNPDTVPPVLNCPANLVKNTDAGQCSAVATFSPTAADSCGIASLVCTPASGSTFPVGLTNVTCIAADSAGNADTCAFTVTVNDAEPPQAICPASTMVNNEAGTCAATVNFAANVSDNCPGATVACAPPSGSSFPVGLTTVICIATDSAGNADTCTFTVTVNDTEPPQASCPTNILVNNDAGTCAATVNFAASASDNCPGVTLVCTPPSGSVFPAGLTDVNCVATDGAGNKDSCQFTVIVNDTEKPVLDSVACQTDYAIDNDPGQCGAVVNFSVSATDNCPGVSVNCVPPSGSFFPAGTATTVTCTATDASGNKDSCSFLIPVADTEKPAISCPADVIAFRSPSQCDSVAANFTVSASDNCPGVSVACNPPSGSKFPLGNSAVNCTATDGAGNKDSCNFAVSVFKGDMDDDGLAGPTDVVLLLVCVFVGTGNCAPCVADLDCNGLVDPPDVVFALLAVFTGQYHACSP